MDFYIGTIIPWVGTFAPAGWAFCQGQTLNIQTNQGLFAVIGNKYGGNGTTNFMLPNFKGSGPIGMGTGTGLTTRILGTTYGEAGVTLTVSQIPAHNHLANVNTGIGNQNTPIGNIPAATGTGIGDLTFNPETDGSFMNSAVVQTGGAAQPHPNYQPSLVVNYIIATTGLFPVNPS